MFDAFARFANGIISHESSNQGGGGGHHPYSRRPQVDSKEETAEQELHLAPDSLRLSSAKSLRIAMLPPDKAPSASGKSMRL